MRLLIDEDVPDELALLCARRDHEVIYVRDRATGEEDDVDAKLADELHATVLTFNTRDWRRLIARRPVGGHERFRHAGRVSFVDVHQLRGLGRLQQVIESIEFEYERAQGLPDTRLIMEVHLDYFRVFS